MRIVSEKTLAKYRGPGRCEWCCRPVSRREAAHVFARGMGSGGRLDIDINLVALCGAFSGGLNCHHESHQGREPTTDDLLAVVAAREGTTQDAIRVAVRDLRRLDKDSPDAEKILAAFAKGRK